MCGVVAVGADATSVREMCFPAFGSDGQADRWSSFRFVPSRADSYVNVNAGKVCFRH